MPSRRHPVLKVAAVAVMAGVFAVLWWTYSLGLPLRAEVISDAGRFTLAAPLPEARTEAGGAVLDSRLYVAGGLGPQNQSLASFYAYDPEFDTWERLPDLPTPLNHPGVVAADGKLWVVGSMGPLGIRLRGFMFARWNPRSEVFVYDPAARNWTDGPPMPEPRGAGGVAVAEGAIWYVGGINAALAITNDLFRLDLTTLKWERKAPMPTARDHLRMEAVDGRLYAISGREDDLQVNLAVTERYDIVTDSWTRVTDTPNARGGFGSAVAHGFIYTFGGEYPWTTLSAIERYNPQTDSWSVVGELPESRHGIVAGTIGTRIHLVSGGRRPRVSVSGIHRVLQPPGH
jgi:N-acetylneuraminic acid mutarotase